MARINDTYDIGAAFEAVEDELMASMIRNMKRHRIEEVDEEKEWEMWQTLQLKALEKYKKSNAERFQGKFKDINGKIEALLYAAREQGGMEQEMKILRAIKKGFRPPKQRTGSATTVAEFFKVNDRKLDALIKATQNDFQKAETAVLRMANDQYRKIIYNAQVYANTGAGTYEKAVDMATKDFLSRGINSIEYANGARHTIKDYAAMAIQTASKRAYLQGEGEMRKEWGITTVIMNKRGNACPKCLPFVGKVLIDDVWSGGKASDGPYPLMSSAIAAGLYHPRCKDSHTTYFEGISTPPDSKFTRQEIQEIEDGYRTEQKQQYAKRQADRFGRLAEYSLDEENQEKYRRKERTWKNVKFRTGTENIQEYVDEKREQNFFGIPVDETASWIGKGNKIGKVEDLQEYFVNGAAFKVDGKRVLLDYSEHEKEIANIIAKGTGKDIKMVPRITFPQNIQTPDYLIDGIKFDLKTPLGNGKNTLYGMVKSKKKQANNFVICADKTALSMDEIEQQIQGIYSSRNTAFVDTIILVKNQEIVKIYKRNK
nr:MAG TPA: minor capsid protein [Bacteriophage sp.]